MNCFEVLLSPTQKSLLGMDLTMHCALMHPDAKMWHASYKSDNANVFLYFIIYAFCSVSCVCTPKQRAVCRALTTKLKAAEGSRNGLSRVIFSRKHMNSARVYFGFSWRPLWWISSAHCQSCRQIHYTSTNLGHNPPPPHVQVVV